MTAILYFFLFILSVLIASRTVLGIESYRDLGRIMIYRSILKATIGLVLGMGIGLCRKQGLSCHQ